MTTDDDHQLDEGEGRLSTGHSAAYAGHCGAPFNNK